MSPTNPTDRERGLTLRQAAVIAGLGYLVSPVPFAEFYVFPKLVIPGNIEQTTQNIIAHQGLFLGAIFCYLITFISDVVAACALYVLPVPVNRSLSLVTAWFKLIYTAIALFGLLNLVTVFRLLNTPYYPTIFGSGQLQAQVHSLQPYLFPNAHLGFISIAFFAELLFMFWLLVRGWKIQELR